MGGKRQANVLSALIKNFDTVESAIEASAGSAGSALAENERWLDSIAGKINQFNNAVQSLWQNLLGSDVIKGIVEWGTKIIKSLDTVQGKFLAIVKIAAILMAYKKINPLDWIKSASVFAQNLNPAIIKQYVMSLLGIGPAMKTMTAETMANTLATTLNDDAKTKAALSSLGLTSSTEMLSLAQRKQAIETLIANQSTNGLTNTQIAAIASSWGLKTSIDATTGSIAVLDTTTKSFMATNPVGWILAIVSALVIVSVIVSQIPSKLEKLTEELDNLKSELRDIQSELESVNSELETTEDRMSELLAKDKLSFVEKEELNNLRKQNNELQRRADLLELQNKSKIEEAGNTFVETMKEDLNKGSEYYGGRKVTWFDYLKQDRNSALTTGKIMGLFTEDQYIKEQIEQYKDLQQEIAEYETKIINSGNKDKKAIKKKKELEEEAKNIKSYIDDKTAELNKNADGIDYGDNAEVNKWLDYIRNLEDYWAIIQDGENAKVNAISRIFDKDENSNISATIDDYVEELKRGKTHYKTEIEKIFDDPNNQYLVDDINESGLSVDEVVEYFTSFASDANYSTIEGKFGEVEEAGKRLGSLLSGAFTKGFVGPMTQNQQPFANMFNENGEVLSDAVAEYFGGEGGGISPETQAAIEKLVQQIYDGKISVEDALKEFELFSIQSTLDIYIDEVKTNFKDVFVDLEDADGLIDTFEELGEAIGSAAGALETFKQAQAEMAHSGHVSIETALQLMEYTDDYGSILEVVNGKLRLVDGAEDALIKTRIEAIKTSAEASLADAQAAYEKARDAVTTYQAALTTDKSAEVVAKSWEKVLAAGAGLMEGIKSLLTDESWTDAYNRGYERTLSNITGYETVYNDAGLQSLVEAEAEAKEAVDAAQDRVNLANQLTSETLDSIYNSDTASGGNKTKDEVEDDIFQREMDYWENRIGANQAKYEQLQNEIDLLEAKGQKADSSFYEEQIELEKERQWLLEQQKAAAQVYLKELEAAGKEGSEEWWEVANTLNDIEGELDDVTASIVDLQDAIGEIDTYKFEEFNNRLDNLTSKLETIRNLIAPDGEEDWFDDNGDWTEAGVAVLGSYLQDLEMYKQGYQNTLDDMHKYADAPYESNKEYYEELGIHSEQEWYDKQEELINQQYDYMESINDTEQSIVGMYESSIDAVEEYTNSLVDSYNDYIDSVKEALDAERDLYDFKKNVQKQAKDIAEIERRIMSLSGSTNAADIAERRRLEADLYGAREELDDTYYDHAKDSQQNALDAEAEAYEEQMTKFVEGLRTSLEEATLNMDEFLMGVTSMVMYNADTVLTKYEETNLPLTTELTNPWIKAKEAVGNYSGDALALMNEWTKEGGFFAQFNSTGTTNLQSPWSAGTNAAKNFGTDVAEVMSGVVGNIESNVQSASTKLSELYNQIITTEQRAASANVTASGGNTETNDNTWTNPRVQKRYYTTATLKIGSATLTVTKSDPQKHNAEKLAKLAITGEYEKHQKAKGLSEQSYENSWQRTYRDRVQYKTDYYAKGTLGTKRDEWAVTDEPQFGDELTMYATPEGTLSFMRAGSTVIPADLTRELIDLPKVVDGLINRPKFDSGVNMIANAINKPEIVIDVENFLKVDRVDKDSLPQLEAMMDKKIDTFAKQLNYSLKKFSR